MKLLHYHAHTARAIVTGLLVVFIFFILNEQKSSVIFLMSAAGIFVVAWWLAKITANHFHGGHTHEGDSYIDVIPTIILLLNTLHPLFDGFSLFETYDEQGVTSGIILLGGVVLHEIVRQSALTAVFKEMGSYKAATVIGTAVFGFLIGITTGVVGNEFLHKYEAVVDLATLFAYAFIIFEFWMSSHTEKTEKWKQCLLIAVGMMIAVIIHLIGRGH